MIFRLLAAFILVPLVELFLLLQLAQATSVSTTLLIVIVTGVIGTFLARREGMMTWFRFQSALSEGRVPSRELQEGLMIVFAAALLLTPGLLTDAFGFALLIPTSRGIHPPPHFVSLCARIQRQCCPAHQRSAHQRPAHQRWGRSVRF